MLTQKPAEATATTSAPATTPAPAARAAGADLESMICYFEGRFVPLREAKVSIMTHAFMYGTAVFEGIRAYWNEEQGQLYALKVREHVERIRSSCKVLLMDDIPSVDELTSLILEVARRNGFREDTYIRPSFYKSTQAIGVKLHGLQHQLYILSLPFGNYVDVDTGIRVGTVSWRRVQDDALPARSKIVGAYVNSAFAKSEAMLNGYDEALVLDARRPCVGGLRGEPVHRPRRRADHAAGVRRHPRGDHARRDHGDRGGAEDPVRRALDRPHRGLRRRRGLHVRDRAPRCRR